MAIQIRRGTNQEWESGNSNIVVGEPAVATDTGRFFVGTGAGTYQEYLKVAQDGSIETPKIITADPAGKDYPLIMDNGTNMWLGATATAARHHVGAMFLSAGWNPTTEKGNTTVKIAVPNDANDGATVYDAWHSGNLPRFAYNPTNASNITKTDIGVYGQITASSKTITLYVPIPIVSGTVTCTELSLSLLLSSGEIPYIRSGSNGSVYTNLRSSRTSIISNGKYVRNNEIDSISYSVRGRSILKIVINTKYALATTSGGTTAVKSLQPVTGIIDITATLS